MIDALGLGVVVVIVSIVLLVRSRSGGTGSRSVDDYHHLEGGPIGYGEFLHPPGTSAEAEVNAPWFGREHEDSSKRSSGPDE